MNAKSAIEDQLKRWGSECDVIDAERQILRNAHAILGDDLLKHSIELLDMKMLRLQRCIIDLQGVVMDLNCEAMRALEEWARLNVEPTGRQIRVQVPASTGAEGN